MATTDLPGFGEELTELKFVDFWDWFVHIGNPYSYWLAQPTYIISQAVFLFGALTTLIHAFVNGGRLPYLWLGIILHGFVIECLSYWLPDIDNFWHSQTPIIFLGRRLPLHIIFLYPVFVYNASVAVAKLHLPSWSEPFAVGLCSVLTDIPYDIVSVRFLHWTWHDTDPNIYDRHYWVPWNSYYFHATFAASFTFWFHITRRWFCKGTEKWQSSSKKKELLCTVIAGLLGMPGGILLFLPLYHPLHDLYKIHSEVTFFILFVIFLLLSWIGERISGSALTPKKNKPKNSWTTYLLITHLIIHYGAFFIMTIFFNPENETAIGIKETIGPCDEYDSVHTAFGSVLQKRRYLCATDYNEDYFDFSCLPGGKPPKTGSSWYTACGTPFENRIEYISIIGIICVLGATVYFTLHFFSSGDIFNNKSIRRKMKSKNQ